MSTVGRSWSFVLPLRISLVALLLLPTRARAAESCRSVTLVERVGLSDAFRQAAHALRTELVALPHEDCVEVTLVLEAAGARARLVAITREGQHTERDIGEPSALRALALGLIAVATPEPSPSMSDEDPLRPSAADQPPHDPAPGVASEVGMARPPAKQPARDKPVHFVLGVETGVRLAEPSRVVMGEVNAHAEVAARNWLVGLSVRYAPFGVRAGGKRIPGFEYTELAVGPDFGRRIGVGPFALDLLLSPSVVVTSEGSAVADPDNDVDATNVDVRLSTAARLMLPFAGTWRPCLTLDADVAPFSIGAPTSVDPILPPLPTWSLGLRLGAAGDL